MDRSRNGGSGAGEATSHAPAPGGPERRLVNLGCGGRHHPGWTNVDLVAGEPDVLVHDVRRGILLADGAADAVYHSHLLEHLRPEEGRTLLAECYRVLAPGGILRVAVPDLEAICSQYLEALHRSLGAGDRESRLALEWMTIELLDQMIRERSGGEMLRFLAGHPDDELAFALRRTGEEGRSILAQSRAISGGGGVGAGRRRGAVRALRRVARWARDRLLELLAGRGAPGLLAAARFRESGEVHRWMYDRSSLATILRETGFEDVRVCAAGESRIPQFPSFHLEINSEGAVAKPDSLFVEAVRPGRPRAGSGR